MKTLIIVRHAKSSWDNPFLSDFDRPLNNRGLRDAPRMGKRLKEKEITPDLMLSSPAERALKTCQIMAKILGYKESLIKTNRQLYHADEEQILSVIQQMNEAHDLVMIFGHNPGLTDFVNELANERISNIPTCGIASCQSDVSSWKDMQFGTCKLLFFDYPKSRND
jgi:phosphohistidine phosphatase